MRLGLLYQMNILLIIISLILGIFSHPAYAESEIVFIDTVPAEEIFTNQTFFVNVKVEGADPYTTFFYKFYGGIGDSLFQIQTNQELTYDYPWGEFPYITTNSDGYAYTNTSAYIGPNNPPGEYKLYVMLAYENYGDNPTEYSSLPFLINISQPINDPTSTSVPPTNTPVPPIPTNTPISTSTLTPSPTPTVHQRSVPTTTPTPTINPKIFGAIIDISNATSSANSSEPEFIASTETVIDQIQAGSNPVIEKKDENNVEESSKKLNLLPFFFAALGVIFLIIPPIFSKLIFKPKCLKK